MQTYDRFDLQSLAEGNGLCFIETLSLGFDESESGNQSAKARAVSFAGLCASSPTYALNASKSN